MSVIKRQDIINDEAFNSLDELAKKLQNIINIGKTAQSSLSGKGVSNVTKETKELSLAEQELAKITKQIETAKARQTDEYVKQQKELVSLRKNQKQLVDESGRELGTIEKLTKRNRDLTEQRKRLNLSTSEGRKQLSNINKELDKNNKVLKDSNDALGKQRLNIGNYQSALQGLPGPLGAAARATSGLTKSALAFIATPIGAVIAALGVAITALTSYFRGSEEGQNALNKVTKAATVIWGNLTDILSDAGKLIFSLVTGDMEAMKQAWADLKDGVSGFVAETKEEIKIQNRLSDLRAKNLQLTRESRLFEAKSLTEIANLREKAAQLEETNAAESAKLIKRAIELNDQIAAKKEEVLRNDLLIASEEAKLSKSTTETLNAIVDAEVALENARRERATANVRRIKELNTLEKKAETQKKNQISIEVDLQEAQRKTLTISKDHTLEKIELESKLVDAVKMANLEKIKADEAAEQRRTEIAQEQSEARKEIVNTQIDFAKEVFSGFTQLRIQQISDELNALEFARNRELEAAGESEAAKFQINQEFDQKRKALQRKQANAEKANTVFGIILNTALGIANAASKVVTLPLIPYIAGLGAAQLAVALAQKPPQFDTGTDRTPSEYEIAEKRPEFKKDARTGKWSLITKPTIFRNSPGDKIISGKETDSILGTISDITGRNILNNNSSLLSLLNNEMRYERPKDNLAYILQSNNDKLISTIKNKKETHVSVNKSSGAKVWEKSGNTIIYRPDFYYKR